MEVCEDRFAREKLVSRSPKRVSLMRRSISRSMTVASFGDYLANRDVPIASLLARLDIERAAISEHLENLRERRAGRRRGMNTEQKRRQSALIKTGYGRIYGVALAAVSRDKFAADFIKHRYVALASSGANCAPARHRAAIYASFFPHLPFSTFKKIHGFSRQDREKNEAPLAPRRDYNARGLERSRSD